MSDKERSELAFLGRAWVFGDNIPTDHIVASHLVFKPMEEMAKHVLESHNPDFPLQVQPDDILVAGVHFGQSSGRAMAPKALQATKIGCIVAESFARTFLRNAYEIGLPILECPGITSLVVDGDQLTVDIPSGVIRLPSGDVAQARPTDPFLLAMLSAGGIIPLVRQRVEAGQSLI